MWIQKYTHLIAVVLKSVRFLKIQEWEILIAYMLYLIRYLGRMSIQKNILNKVGAHDQLKMFNCYFRYQLLQP